MGVLSSLDRSVRSIYLLKVLIDLLVILRS